MKESLGSYLSQFFHMPSLTRADLQEIETIVVEKLKPTSYHIAFRGWRYERLSEISAQDPVAHTFVFYSRNPSFRLKLSRSWAELYSDEDDPQVQATLREIAAIVSRCERQGLWLFCRKAPWLAPLVGFGTVVIVSQLVNLKVLSPSWLFGLLPFLAFISVWWGMGHFYTAFGYSRIDLSDRPRS